MFPMQPSWDAFRMKIRPLACNAPFRVGLDDLIPTQVRALVVIVEAAKVQDSSAMSDTQMVLQMVRLLEMEEKETAASVSCPVHFLFLDVAAFLGRREV